MPTADPEIGNLPLKIPRYSAFISYNHRDRRHAIWLHRALETYVIPSRMRGRLSPWGPLGARLPPVFRDREELAASSDLASSVRSALEQSHSLIVLCSPNAVQSKWVNEEIRAFTALGRRHLIQCLIVGDDSESMPGAADELFFPAALFENGASQPLAADLRAQQDGPSGAKLKLIASLIGVGYDELRQREHARRARRLLIAVASLGTAFLLMTALAVLALLSRNDAIHQRDIARQKTMTAERTVEFVKSLFAVSDPSEARGESVTAREILDRGADQIQSGLAGEPSVKAELSTTLGEVYGGLGLYRRGEALIRQGLGLPNVEPSTRARQHVALGEARARQGDYSGAVQDFSRALAESARTPDPSAALTSRALDGLGEAYSAANNDKASDKVLGLALKMDQARGAEGRADVARDLEALGYNDVDAKRYARAQERVEQALVIRVNVQGPRHPKVGEDLNALGAIAYFQGRPLAAEDYYRRSLALAKVVIGPNHPDTATIMNNLARLMIERRDFIDAEPLLADAVDIILSERDESYDDLAFSFDNLALAKRGLGDERGAEALLTKALKAARVHRHRNLAPILVDQADMACARGDPTAGFSLLDEARPQMARDYPDDPWRVAWVDVVRGGCLAVSGRAEEGLSLLERAGPAVLARWNRDSLFGARTARLMALARGRTRS